MDRRMARHVFTKMKTVAVSRQQQPIRAALNADHRLAWWLLRSIPQHRSASSRPRATPTRFQRRRTATILDLNKDELEEISREIATLVFKEFKVYAETDDVFKEFKVYAETDDNRKGLPTLMSTFTEMFLLQLYAYTDGQPTRESEREFKIIADWLIIENKRQIGHLRVLLNIFERLLRRCGPRTPRGPLLKAAINQLPHHLAQMEDPYTTAYLIDRGIKRTMQDDARTLTTTHMRRLYTQLNEMIQRDKAVGGDAFELRVMLGRFLEATGNVDAAIRAYESAVPDAQKASKSSLPRAFQDEDALGAGEHTDDPLLVRTPWTHLMRLIEGQLRTDPDATSRGARFERYKKYVAMGLDGDDAYSNYYAASQYDIEHRAAQLQPEYDKELKMTREARDPARIGKPSRWLFHMTKAAASNVPEACMHLGDYYLSTPWRYLDDEPFPEMKPTPFDRYPEGHILQSVKRRFLLALGIPSGDAKPQDLFTTAALPTAAEQRIMLGEEWLKLAAKSGYPLAMLRLSQLYAAESVLDTSMRGGQHPYESKTKYWDAIFEGQDDQRVYTQIPNPKYNEDAAKEVLADVFHALHVQQAIQTLSNRGLERLSDREKIELDHWRKYASTIHIWVKDKKLCQGMSRDARRLADSKGWDIYDKDKVLLYKADKVDKRDAVASSPSSVIYKLPRTGSRRPLVKDHYT